MSLYRWNMEDIVTMRCRRCNNIIPDGEVICPVCRMEVQIVPDYNPLDDVLENQVRGGVTQALNTDIGTLRQGAGTKRPNGQRQNTSRTGETKNKRVKVNGSSSDYEARMRRRKQMERKRAIAKKKRQRMLLTSAFAIIFVLVLAVVIYQNSYPGQIKKGYNLLAEKQYEEAIIRFQKALAKNDEKAEAYVGIASVYLAQRDLDGAEKIYMDAISEHPDNVVIYEAAIQFYIDINQESKIAYLLEDCKSESVLNSVEQYTTDVPSFSLDESETYDDIQALELTGTGKAIYYTTDGSDPTTSSSKYDKPIKIEEGETTVKAISVNELDIPSIIVSKTYLVEFPIAEAPSVTPSTGQYDTRQYVSVVVPDNYEAYYTTDGSDPVPGQSGTKQYSKAVSMPEGNTIFKVVLVDQKGRLSDITIRNYELILE